MAKLLAIYEKPIDQEGFENHYYNVHIPLAQKLPHIKSAEVHRVMQAQNTDQELFLIAELQFETKEEMFQALSSPEGKEMAGDGANLLPYLSKPPVVTIVD